MNFCSLCSKILLHWCFIVWNHAAFLEIIHKFCGSDTSHEFSIENESDMYTSLVPYIKSWNVISILLDILGHEKRGLYSIHKFVEVTLKISKSQQLCMTFRRSLSTFFSSNTIKCDFVNFMVSTLLLTKSGFVTKSGFSTKWRFPTTSVCFQNRGLTKSGLDCTIVLVHLKTIFG